MVDPRFLPRKPTALVEQIEEVRFVVEEVCDECLGCAHARRWALGQPSIRHHAGCVLISLLRARCLLATVGKPRISIDDRAATVVTLSNSCFTASQPGAAIQARTSPAGNPSENMLLSIPAVDGGRYLLTGERPVLCHSSFSMKSRRSRRRVAVALYAALAVVLIRHAAAVS